MIESLQNFQEALGPFVVPVLVGLGSLLFFIILIYLIGVFLHWRNQKSRETYREAWRSSLLGSPGYEGSSVKHWLPEDQNPPARFKDDFLEVLEEGNLEASKRASIYREIGFYAQDETALSSRTWWKKVQAIDRLKRVSLDGLEDEISSLIYDANHDVRLNALNGLSFLDRVPELDPLELFANFSERLDSYLLIKLYALSPGSRFIRPLVNSKRVRLRKAGAILLGQPGKTEFLPLLEKLTDDDEDQVRLKAAESVGRVGEAGAIAPLRRASKDPTPSVREAVAQSLGEVQREGSIELLEGLAGDDDFRVRLAAFSSLARFGEKGRQVIGKHWGDNRRLAREAIYESYQE